MSQVITTIEQVTPTWLTGVLRKQGCLTHGEVIEVQPQLRLTGASMIIPLSLRYSADAPAIAPPRLFLKFPAQHGLNANPKEVEFYTHIAIKMPDPPLIRCYDAAFDELSGRFHLLMEDLSDTHIGHPPSMVPPTEAQANQIIEALAHLHGYWWDHPNLGQDVGALPTETSLNQQMAWYEETFVACADFLGDRLSPARRRVYERVLASFPPVCLERLIKGHNLTLIHDDPHPGNFLYPRNPAKDRLRIIDWKSWHVAIGPSDLAHMMAVFWFPERRARFEQELLRRYYEHLLAKGVGAYSWEACWYDYRFAVINHLAYPLWQWAHHLPDFIWWHHLERLMLAFDDLGCAELLG